MPVDIYLKNVSSKDAENEPSPNMTFLNEREHRCAFAAIKAAIHIWSARLDSFILSFKYLLTAHYLSFHTIHGDSRQEY